MILSVEKLQEFLHTELCFEDKKITARSFRIWNRFFSASDFIFLRPIKDRSHDGLLKILKGEVCRWQIRIGVHQLDDVIDYLVVTLWDSGEGITYDALLRSYIDRGKPVYMARKVMVRDNIYEQITRQVGFLNDYALAIENECPKCGSLLVPRKARKLMAEDPYTLASVVSGTDAIPKQRTYLCCQEYPTCKHIASYVKV